MTAPNTSGERVGRGVETFISRSSSTVDLEPRLEHGQRLAAARDAIEAARALVERRPQRFDLGRRVVLRAAASAKQSRAAVSSDIVVCSPQPVAADVRVGRYLERIVRARCAAASAQTRAATAPARRARARLTGPRCWARAGPPCRCRCGSSGAAAGCRRRSATRRRRGTSGRASACRSAASSRWSSCRGAAPSCSTPAR